MRAAIEWSYRLLSPEEQTLFAQLGVFAGGFTLDAVERICDADADVIQSLLDKSLIRGRPEPGSRFRMLETIREFAAQTLERDGGSEELRRGPLLVLRGPARAAASRSRRVPRLSDRGDRGRDCEHPRGARVGGTRSARPRPPGDRSRPLLGDSGQFAEAEMWSRRALAECPPEAAAERAGALVALGTALSCLGDQDGACEALEAAAAALRKTQDGRQLARALNQLGSAAFLQRDLARARAAFEESCTVAKRSGNREDALQREAQRRRGGAGDGRDAATALTLFEEQAEAAAAIGDERISRWRRRTPASPHSSSAISRPPSACSGKAFP